MPEIRVTCPTCKSELEIDAVHEGEEIECGNCLQVFVATTKKRDPGSSGSGGSRSGSGRGSPARSRGSRDDDDEDRPRRRRRDDDEDDEDYDRPRRSGGQGNSALAIVSLVFGILGLVPGCFCCWVGFPMSLIATVLGGVGLGTPQGKGMAIAGLILGVCGMIFNVIRGALLGFAF